MEAVFYCNDRAMDWPETLCYTEVEVRKPAASGRRGPGARPLDRGPRSRAERGAPWAAAVEGRNERPFDVDTALKASRPENEGTDLSNTMNRDQNLVNGEVPDFHRDRRGKLPSVRSLRGIDSKVTLNKGIGGIAERLANKFWDQRLRQGHNSVVSALGASDAETASLKVQVSDAKVYRFRNPQSAA